MPSKPNRIAGRAALIFSLVALATILIGIMQPSHPPETDEGTLAHIFQLSVAFLGLAVLLFLVTTDWSRPLRGVRPLALPGVLTILAFTLLFYFEHAR